MSLSQYGKFVGGVAVFFGIFGVCYQKGLILGMNIGNLSGNYEVREVFNSALLGCIHVFEKLDGKNVFIALQKNIYELSILFLFIGFLVSFVYKRRDRILSYTESNDLQKNIKIFFDRVLSSYIISSFLGLISGGVFGFLSILVSYFFIAAIGVLILPALLGYIVGFSKVESLKDNNPCVPLNSDVVSERKSVSQCTHLVIDKKLIRGELVLENSNGYFFNLNSSFLFVSKDGNTCIYSKYLRNGDVGENIKEGQKIEFRQDYIDTFCPHDEI